MRVDNGSIKIESTYDCEVILDMIFLYLQEPHSLLLEQISEMQRLRNDIQLIYQIFTQSNP